MSQRILLIENDQAFAAEVRTRFQGAGAEVIVVEDGTAGIESAEQQTPDLILLAIELTGMNGFLVCKKIKKHPALCNVPILILSSEASEDTFEQHRKLRTRAEDYLRKPMTADDLFARARSWLTHLEATNATEESAAETATVEDVIVEELDLDAELLVEDDFEEIEGASFVPAPSSYPPAAGAQSMRSSAPPPSHSLPPLAAFEPQVAPLAMDAAEPGSEQVGVMEEADGAQTAAGQDLARLRIELDQWTRRAEDAEAGLDAANAELKKLRVGKPAGVSSREYLDLKSALNAKDRELLEFREQLAARDKLLVEANERTLQFERESADATDRAAEIEATLAEQRQQVVVLAADKAASQETIRLLQEQIAERQRALEEAREEQAAAKDAHAAELERVSGQYAERIARAAAEHSAAVESLEKAQEDALTQQRDDLEAKKQQALDAQQAQLVENWQAKLDAREVEHRALLERQHEAHESELASLRQALEAQYQAQLKEQDEGHSRELALLGRRLTETAAKLGDTEEQLRERERSLEDAHAQAQELGMRLERALGRLHEDAQVNERVRKALTIGLMLLEDQTQGEAEETV